MVNNNENELDDGALYSSSYITHRIIFFWFYEYLSALGSLASLPSDDVVYDVWKRPMCNKWKKEKMNETQKIQKRYNRYSYIYDYVECPCELFSFKNYRKKILSDLKGKVLEVGVGTGKNIPYYNNVEYTGIDFSKNMLAKAKKKFPKTKLLQMDAQELEFKDSTFDYIITSFVLCSVPDPVKALKEMKRVIKKEGKIIMLEHVRSKNRIIALLQDIHNPLTRFFFGFNINRDTKHNIHKAGLVLTKDQALAFGDVLRLFEARKGD